MSTQATSTITIAMAAAPGGPLRVELGPDALDAFCQRLIRQSRSPADLLLCLTTLQSFISQFAGGTYHGDRGASLQSCLDAHLEAARTALLAQQAQRLRDAWQARDVGVLADCYTQLSRSGFRQAVSLGLARLGVSEQASLRTWVDAQLQQIELRARGRYPDTFDYAAAGIDPAVHCVLTDLAAALSAQQDRHHVP